MHQVLVLTNLLGGKSRLIMEDIEDILSRWAQAPSETEEEKCAAAIRRITRTVKEDERLSGRNIQVFRQGSYENRTNVKKDSDVDIVVCLYDAFFHDGLSEEDEKILGLRDAEYGYYTFKRDVEEILINEFGNTMVERKNKCIIVKGNDYRVTADVVPCLEHRRYSSRDNYISGIEFWSEGGKRIINWPKQHYENGVLKNNTTDRAFKSVVRILKNAKNDMVDTGLVSDDSMPSFLLECLVWNVPDENFKYSTWTAKARAVLAKLFNDTLKKEGCWDYTEVSDLKWLFRGDPKWTHQTANDFLGKVWDYLGYD